MKDILSFFTSFNKNRHRQLATLVQSTIVHRV